MLDKEQLKRYVDSMGGSEVMEQRAQRFLAWAKRLCPEDIEDVVITEYVKDDGSRIYEGLWFFSGSFFMEAKQFLNADLDDIDLASSKILRYLNFQMHKYDLEKAATKESRLNVKLANAAGISADLRVSGQNCDHLREIVFKYELNRRIGASGTSAGHADG